MKSRPSYFFISGIIILSVFLGTFIWHNQHLKEIHKFKEASFTAPTSSKYIPINADLVFHWKINPSLLPDYIEDYQDKVNKKITNKTVKLIRDSSLKLINLDFTKDISSWSGGYGSFAIFETNKQFMNDWLMVLEIKEDINIVEELESTKNEEIIDSNVNLKNNLNISNSKIFSKNINSNQSIYFLKEKEHILISSNPKIIKSSIYNLENNILASRKRYKNIQLKDKINDGILLLELSPRKILNLIGKEEDPIGINQTNNLIISFNVDKEKLIFEGILSYDTRYKRAINDLSYDFTDMEEEFNLFDNLVLIDNPKKYFTNNSSHPYQKLIASIIRNSTSPDYSKIFEIILENTKGNLIWLKDKEWLAITRKVDIDKRKINDLLKKDKFANSDLEFRNKILEVWSKITTNSNDNYEIKENIEAITEGNEDVYIWSQDLSSISNFDDKEYSLNSLNDNQIESQNNDFDDVIRMHLDQERTAVLLNNFYPYVLLRTMLGNELDFPQSIDISVAMPTINYPDFVKFKINLKTS